MRIEQGDGWKRLRSPGYNFFFNRRTGFFARWGVTQDDDPSWSPYGPEIADVEVSTGDCSSGCAWCYKSNARNGGRHMSVARFREVLAALPDTLTQVALGVTDADRHPDFIGLLRACRERGVVPNYTTAGYGLTDEIVDATREMCGAVAVSAYPHNDWRGTVRRFAPMKQVNVHLLFHSGNGDFVRRVLREAEEVEGLNAVVLLGLKPKGRGADLRPMSREEFSEIVSGARVRLGFDSCTAPKFEAWARENGREDQLVFSERCESSLFSIYVDVEGRAWPCSFGEGHPDLEPLPVEKAWAGFAPFRKRLLANGRECPLYKLD